MLYGVSEKYKVSRHDIAAIWVAFFSRRQRYRCGQLHTNFDGTAVGPDEADFHNDLKNKVITPEHTIDSYCRCAACVAADEARRGDEAKEVKKDGMIWNTTENATKQQDKDFAKLISQTSFWKDREPTEAEDGRFWRKEFHKLQVSA